MEGAPAAQPQEVVEKPAADADYTEKTVMIHNPGGNNNNVPVPAVAPIATTRPKRLKSRKPIPPVEVIAEAPIAIADTKPAPVHVVEVQLEAERRKKTSGGNRLLCPGYNRICTQVSVGTGMCYACTMLKDGTIVGCRKPMSNAEFARRASIMHNGKYTYANANYKNNNTLITITCPIHGDFTQIPMNHLKGNGCSKCGNHQKDTDEFVAHARTVHGNTYDYSKVVYIKSDRDVIIICAEHGEFNQTPNSHLNGRGCIQCGQERTVAASTKDLAHFLVKAALKQPIGAYSYVKSVYVRNNQPLEIHCNTCGRDFWQTPDAHYAGKGCAYCNKSKMGRMTHEILSRLGYEHESEQAFPTCRDIRPLPFDYGISSLNLLIELDGEQHFTACENWGGADGYVKRLFHDNIKDVWAIESKRILLRISYDDVDNIEELIMMAIEWAINEPVEAHGGGYILATKFYETFTDRDTKGYITLM
jgi:hypothetical protein